MVTWGDKTNRRMILKAGLCGVGSLLLLNTIKGLYGEQMNKIEENIPKKGFRAIIREEPIPESVIWRVTHNNHIKGHTISFSDDIAFHNYLWHDGTVRHAAVNLGSKDYFRQGYWKSYKEAAEFLKNKNNTQFLEKVK